jgi:hypothetical protein
VHGFPNCFVESIAQSGFTVNFPYLLDVQARHVAWVIASAVSRGIVEVEATAQAEADWVDAVLQRSALVAERRKACTPGYYNREGFVDERTQLGSFFIGGPTEYADTLESWRVRGTLEGLDTEGLDTGTSR